MSVIDFLLGRTSKHFRTKFMLVTAVGVLLALGLSLTTALINVGRLRQDATTEVKSGFTRANDEYLEKYIETTAVRLDHLFQQTFSEVRMAGTMFQTLIDQPDAQDAMGKMAAQVPYFQDQFVKGQSQYWVQNQPGEPSVLSLWSDCFDPTTTERDDGGKILNGEGALRPECLKHSRENAIFDLFGPAIAQQGSPKLQVYYIGPKTETFMRLTPYTAMAETFFDIYKYQGPDVWEFFYPGMYEGWQKWVKDPSSQPVAKDQVTVSDPYKDAATGAPIISFFAPLWTKDRKDCAGAAAIDITLEHAANLIANVRIKSTGFAFLALSNGNVLAMKPEGEKVLGIETQEEASKKGDGETCSKDEDCISRSCVGGICKKGVFVLSRYVGNSIYQDIKKLSMPTTETPVSIVAKTINDQNHHIVLRRLPGMNFWKANEPIREEHWVLGFVVPESELLATVYSAEKSIAESSTTIISTQLVITLGSFILVLLGVFLVARTMTGELVALSKGATRMREGDLGVRVSVASQDEIGQLGVAFNDMASEIQKFTNNLQEEVDKKTKELREANEEIRELNAKLAQENIRMSAELNVARQLQLMVLPPPNELSQIPGLDISGYMAPADEVGGDYYDVLRSNGVVKIGIGDVTGHGLESGVLMLMVQTAVRTLLAAEEKDPKKFLNIVNKVIYQNVKRLSSDKYLTLALLDYSEGRLQLTGQHEDLIIVRNTGELERVDTTGLGLPIGLDLDVSDFISSLEIKISSGDVVTLFSDGITEAEDSNQQQYGLDRLCDIIKKSHAKASKEIKDAIIEDVLAYIGSNKIHDDITVLVVKRL